jgi:bacillithiol synthase
MKKELIRLADIQGYPKLLLDYLQGSLAPSGSFTSGPPSMEGLKSSAQKRLFDSNSREILVRRLRSASYHTHPAQEENLLLLAKENTVTITTGHQLNLATGPLYFIYKIISALRLAEQFNSTVSDQKAVPVYWMASEDHDLEEISSFYLFGKTYTWAGSEKGAVGQMRPPDKEFWSQIPDCPQWLKECYLNSSTLAEAHARVVSTLFGSFGLLILEPDDKELKALFSPVVKKELLYSFAQTALLKKTAALEEMGYEPQINGREINLFLISEGKRERILRNGEGFSTAEHGQVFGKEEMDKLLEESPERFSPNVVLRPVYQEYILPNIAYVGGPAEVSYWLQLKGVFEEVETPFPILWPRNFASLIPAAVEQKAAKLKLSVDQLFTPVQPLKKKWLSEQSENTLDFSEENELLKKVFDGYKAKVEGLDKSLVGWVEAERSKTEKQIESIEKRLVKSLEQREQQQLQLLEKLIEKLFPEGALQERKENIFNYLINRPEIINLLYMSLDPLCFDMHLIYLDHEQV